MILPENEFSHLKGVNNQPYLDIWTSASHLTKRFLFSCISFFFLPSYVFYIHPIGHLWAFWLCVKTSLNMRNHSYDLHQPTDSFHDNQTHFCMKVSHEDSFWNRGTRIHSSMSCSQEPLILIINLTRLTAYFLVIYDIKSAVWFGTEGSFSFNFFASTLWNLC